MKCFGPKSEYIRLLRTTCLAEYSRQEAQMPGCVIKALNSILSAHMHPSTFKYCVWFVDFPVIFCKLYENGYNASEVIDFLDGLRNAYDRVENTLPKEAKYNFLTTMQRYASGMKNLGELFN